MPNSFPAIMIDNLLEKFISSFYLDINKDYIFLKLFLRLSVVVISYFPIAISGNMDYIE